YGLGLYGKVGAVQGFVLSVAVFAMQMLLSALYQARLPDGSAGVAVAADFARAAGGCRLTRIAKFKPGEPAAEPARTRD
ncbi:MAG: DUF418 domain-containing protein, partial [Acidobacteria bacterium]|nr:DUF418 domain-containing protein [Acidobacteriota bacterium]